MFYGFKRLLDKGPVSLNLILLWVKYLKKLEINIQSNLICLHCLTSFYSYYISSFSQVYANVCKLCNY